MITINTNYLTNAMIKHYKPLISPDDKRSYTTIKNMFGADIGLKERQIQNFIYCGVYSKKTLEKAIDILNLDTSKLFIKEN